MPQVDSLQKRMLAMSGQDVDAYMKEMEEVHKQTQANKERELQSRLVSNVHNPLCWMYIVR